MKDQQLDFSAPAGNKFQTKKQEELTDISQLPLDLAIPPELRADYMLETIGDPYCFRVGALGVKLEFPDSAPSLQDVLSGFLRRKKSGL